MTLPRPIEAGRTYLITRRCTQRQFLLRPDEKTNQAFLYCLGEAAQTCGMELVGWLAMSNHYHAVVYDPHGRLPEFTCRFHRMLAKVLNVRWSRWENLWSTQQPCYTWLVDPSDIFDKLLYVLLNPVVDHLVDAVTHWPGASSWSLLDGRSIEVERPRFFFHEGGTMPRRVTLRIVIPPCVRGSAEDWRERVRAAVVAREAQIREKRFAARVSVLGRKAIRAASAFDTPKSSAPRRELRPFVACKNLWRRILALDGLVRFRLAHREALGQFAAGVREVLFPFGTFDLRRLGLCRAPVTGRACRPAPGSRQRCPTAYRSVRRPETTDFGLGRPPERARFGNRPVSRGNVGPRRLGLARAPM